MRLSPRTFWRPCQKGAAERPAHPPPAPNATVPAHLAQVLLNKIALSSFRFKAPNALLLFQCAVCVVSVQLCQAFGVVKVEPFSWRVVRVW